MRYIRFTVTAQMMDVSDADTVALIGEPAVKAMMLIPTCQDGQTMADREREIGRSMQARAIEAMRDVLHYTKADA